MKLQGLALIACIFSLTSCTKSPDVIAHVGKTPITQQEFDAYLQLKRLRNLSEEEHAKHLQAYANRQALAQAIQSTNKIDVPKIEAEIQDVKRNLIVAQYLDQYLTQQVSDQAVRNYYAQHADEFSSRKAKVSHILIRANTNTKEAARTEKLQRIQEAHLKATQGADFAALVTEYSQDRVSAAKGGSLGWISDQAIAPNFSHQVFNVLKAGQVSDPFVTSFGYHIVKLDAEPSVIQQPFEKVRGDIRRKLRQMAKDAELKRLQDSIQIEIAGNR